jgi:hypothetical protein
MNDSKVYFVANPALKLKMLRAELTSNSILLSESNNGINEREIGDFPYTEISSVNISLIDINRNQICISLNSGKKLKLISLSVGKLKNGKIYRENVDQKIEFNQWVSEFHKILIDKELANKIDFSAGSNIKTLILIILSLICLMGVFFALALSKTSIAVTLLVGAIIAGTLLFKMGLKKKYNPESKILP